MTAAKKCLFLFSGYDLADGTIEDTIDAINETIEAYEANHPKNLDLSNAKNKQGVNDGTVDETDDAINEALDANPGLNCREHLSIFSFE